MFEHPQNVCMTYTSHLKFSFYLSYTFAKASICALIHGIYPDVFITHSSDTLQQLNREIKKVGCRD
tara:strand:+ start:843 stop:1040 length:198 start_codon:yes stop_codon:yes gene_type:complete